MELILLTSTLLLVYLVMVISSCVIKNGLNPEVANN